MTDVLAELRKVGKQLAPKFPPIPLAMEELGLVGHLENRRGLYINSALRNNVRALLRDEYRAEMAAREITGGRLGADALLPIAAQLSDTRDAVRAIKSLRMALTGQAIMDQFDAKVAAGKSFEFCGFKDSTGTANATQWSHHARLAGYPVATTFGVAPGGTAHIGNVHAGAWPLPNTNLAGAGEHLYLTNLGVNHTVGNAYLLIDMLVTSGFGINQPTVTQNVASTVLPRWSSGDGLLYTIEAVGGTISGTGVYNWTDNAGVAYTGVSYSWSAAINLLSGESGSVTPFLPFQGSASAYGIRSMQQVVPGATGGNTGSAYLVIYKPLTAFMATNTPTFSERAYPLRYSKAIKLTQDSNQGILPCLSMFVLKNTSGAPYLSWIYEVLWG